MKLDHLSLEQLKLSPLNVRSKGGADIADLLPSIRSLGVIQPLLVRPNCEGFEIVAGQRRYHALVKLAGEGYAEPVPVAIMEEGDDAKAIEASLAENVARLPMDEVDQYKAFAALKAQGLGVSEIAARFGITERLVGQRLAIANIIAPILNAYRREEIRPDTLRLLTMATPRQQKAWWKLFRSKDEQAPTGHRLKAWLFGGAQVPVSNALFDVEHYDGAIVSDLFEDERYFADSEAFWALQNTAIAERRDACLQAGWAEVVVLDTGERFQTWEHVKTPKKKGGRVYVAITQDGEVTFHEGWLTEKEVRRLAKAEASGKGGEPAKAERPELTKTMRNYIGLHKHAAVRTELLASPSIALRLAVAHMVAGSGLWTVEAEKQKADNTAIRDSLAASRAQAGFAEERSRIRELLDIEGDGPVVSHGNGFNLARRSLADIFDSLMHMEDAAVLRILAYVMAETLEAQSGIVEALGALLSTDMKGWWTADETFFDLLRDKMAVNAILREVAGDVTADAHIASTAKVQKKIVADCLAGDNGRTKVDGWLPRYMAFPAQGYTPRFPEALFGRGGAGVDAEEGEADDDSDDAEASAEAEDMLEDLTQAA
ncbi:ParB/RepB/Spo0J family partition protein [Mesorhizobium sp. J428]|uniref:ParB/RepB/Spo0J family partition protein n=1 Tax=Mesorhizobium sp. J428 TaxID=2898440 RepID=UPI002150863D|nr:ParB/RepB/Spo0J family partition protein [Mesorhizobium sp. J428]MCR5858274.1 ParB/RepB/Spo0J family partition protein [Mesorhizobium sp. J428]